MVSGPQASQPGLVPAFVVVLTIIAAISYSTFVLEHILGSRLDVLNGYVSELSAIDQPFHLVYSIGDFVTGTLVIVVALVALRKLRRRRWAVTGWVLLMAFGVCAIGDAVFPLDCAPSLETRCALLERGAELSFSHGFHAVTSSLVVIFGVLALAALSLAGRRYGWWPELARWGWLIAAAEAAWGLGTVVFMIYGSWLGLVQRVQISVLVLGLFVIAWALHADRRRARGTAA